MTANQIQAEEYMAATREHLSELTRLPQELEHYPLAYYLAGLTVECMLRAYVARAGAPHDSRHDLRLLSESARLFDLLPSGLASHQQADSADVTRRWLNNHRYRSLVSLRRFLNEAGLYRLAGGKTIRGDVVRYNWPILQEAAINLVSTGVALWTASGRRLKT